MSGNIAQLLDAAARHRPDRTAWVFGEKRSSYGELARHAGALGEALNTLGVRVGDRVVLHLPNGPDFIELLFACFWGGFVPVPVHWQLRSKEVAYVAADCGATVVISASGDVLGQHPNAIEPGSLDVGGSGRAEPVERADDAPAWIFYTSGTTGRPKGAVLTHRNLRAMAMSYLCDVDNVEADATFLHAAPLSHGSGLYLLPAIARGATNVVMDTPRFIPAAFFAAVERHCITHATFLAPTMLKRLTDDGNVCGNDLSSLRSIVVGGAPLYTGDLAAARELFGSIVHQIYGQGESPMTISVMRASDPGAQRRPASAGRAFTGVAVQVRTDDGTPSGARIPGEVCVRGDVVMSGYWDNPDATAAALAGGWLHTGDIGYLDAQGYLFLTDRCKDVIISGGSNVYPREVEEVLLTHPAISQAAVIGMPDPQWGETVCAVVVLASGAHVSEDVLANHCRSVLASYKLPRRFVMRADLPKNAAGKILKRELGVTVEAQGATAMAGSDPVMNRPAR